MRALLLTIALSLLAGPACSGSQVYRWVDKDGRVHYSDQAPADARLQVRQIPVARELTSVASLRIERADGHYEVWADNSLAGPIEVMLYFSKRENVRGEPDLPARATVPAGGSTLVSRLRAVDGSRQGVFELRLEAMPGTPNARPRDVEYLLPLALPQPRIEQGFNGSYSHTDAGNRHALDFSAPVGTPVLAARGGTVMQVESDYAKAGLSLEKYGGRANFVRIVHDDGTMGLYAHLKEGGVHVRVGQQVSAGQRIGLSGNTGFTTGPHLHFVVQVNRGMNVVSIPFKMRGVGTSAR